MSICSEKKLAVLCKEKKVAFFDCDGVLFDSNLVKINALEYALRNLSKNIADHLILSFKKNFGKDRNWHFENFNNILKMDYGISNFDNFITRKDYEDYLSYEYINSSITDGVVHYLNNLNYYNIDCIVVSAGDTKEVQNLMKKNDFSKYFTEIFTSIDNKSKVMNDYLSKNNYVAKQAIFFGDAISDYEASIVSNIDFVYVSNYSFCKINNPINSDIKFYEIENFNYLMSDTKAL